MAMPEATMDEDDLVKSREDKIGLSRQVPGVKSKAEAEGMCSSTDNHLRSSMPLADFGHSLTCACRFNVYFLCASRAGSH